MNKRTKDVIEKAKSMRGNAFAALHYGSRPFCASFVRYVFEKTLGKDGDLPVVQSPPYYKKMGIRNPPGKWFADSLAGDEIGRAVPVKSMQPGDLVFYRDTYRGNFPVGSITHVALCVGAGGVIADARHDPGTIHVGHYTEMNGEVIEVRRPKCLLAGDAAEALKQANIILKNGRAEAILHGTRVNRLEIDFKLSGAILSVHVDKQLIRHKVVDAAIAPSKDLQLSWASGVKGGGVIGYGAGITGNIDSHTPLKIISHNNRSRVLYAGADVKQIEAKILFENYALHIWVNGKETRAREAKILIA